MVAAKSKNTSKKTPVKKVEKKIKKVEKPSKKNAKKVTVAEDESGESDNDDIFKKLQLIMAEASDEEGNDVDMDDEDNDDEEDDEDLAAEFAGFDEPDTDEEQDDEEEGEDSAEKLNKEIDDHKKQLEELKERDPEFYEYLQKENDGLLEFEESDTEMKDEDDEVYSDMEENGLEENGVADLPVLDKKTFAEWSKRVTTKQDLKAFKKILAAFRTAARMSEENDDITFSIKIEDPNVFHKVIVFTLQNAPTFFAHHLKPKKENGPPTSAVRWPYFKTIVKSYLSNLYHLLRNLTDVNMLRMAIREAEKSTPYWVCFDRLTREYLKTLLNAFSSLSSSDSVRVQSFLAIKSIALASVPAKKEAKVQGYLDICLKNIYLTFIKNCKNTNVHSLPVINLMRNLAAQLYGINPVLSYQQGFVYIRQLAIHLRAAMKNRTTKNHNMVYNWQYIHCIDFWADVLNSYSGPMVDEDGDEEESPLKSLIYPLVQVAIGVIQLVPTPQHYPLRFHVLKCLNSIIHNTGVFVPLATYVLEVLESPVATERAKASSGLPLEWDIVLKVHKKIIRGRVYQDDVLEQCAKALKNYYDEYSSHLSFPEMVDADIVTIKRYVKKSSSMKGKEKLNKLIKELDAKANFIRQQREKINFSPKDEDKVLEFNNQMKAKLT
ncbi:Noc2-domain-containing protein [Backusella circina FSU 941]|nr:Noc2-domain-containing protein [Backusella circina FSU 941]